VVGDLRALDHAGFFLLVLKWLGHRCAMKGRVASVVFLLDASKARR